MIVFDTETTGLYDNTLRPLKNQPRIIELYALKLDDETLEEVDKLHELIQPGHALDPEIVQITGITDEMLVGKPSWPLVQEKVCEFWLGQRSMVAHNLSYDRDLLSFELRRTDSLMKFPWPPVHICTVEATEHIKGFRLKLADLHEHLFGEGFPEAHRAEHDTAALVRCVRELRQKGML